MCCRILRLKPGRSEKQNKASKSYPGYGLGFQKGSSRVDLARRGGQIVSFLFQDPRIGHLKEQRKNKRVKQVVVQALRAGGDDGIVVGKS